MLSERFYDWLPAMLDETIARGASYLDGALVDEACAAIAAEVARDEFTTLTPKADRPVVEDMDILKMTLADDTAHPLVVSLGSQLAEALSDRLADKSFAPNEASFHRYHAGTKALGAHRDFRSDKLFVAVFTISGEGSFELLDDDGRVERSWACRAGGLCLMRAPGLTDAEDDRPLHRALAPDSGTREALIYREVLGDYLGKLV